MTVVCYHTHNWGIKFAQVKCLRCGITPDMQINPKPDADLDKLLEQWPPHN